MTLAHIVANVKGKEGEYSAGFSKQSRCFCLLYKAILSVSVIKKDAKITLQINVKWLNQKGEFGKFFQYKTRDCHYVLFNEPTKDLAEAYTDGGFRNNQPAICTV